LRQKAFNKPAVPSPSRRAFAPVAAVVVAAAAAESAACAFMMSLKTS
jgi:hypothetical protein